MAMQRAIYQATGLEVRAGEDGERMLTGYAARFNEFSVPMWGFRERIRPGAFAASLGGDVRALWQHEASQVLGRTKNGTLRLEEDAEGLRFELTPPDTQLGRDAMTLIERGDVDQMSFGFNILPNGSEWEESETLGLIRTLTNVTLMEISPVTWAAYPSTSVGVRAAMRDAMLDGEELPDWVQRALTWQSVDDSAEAEARARRLAMMRRRLDVVSLG